MQYFGGKQKSGGHRIAAVIEQYCASVHTRHVVDTCCGGLSVTYRVAQAGLVVSARDACEPLITLYRHLAIGWEPPAEVSRETWEHYKANQDADYKYRL